MAMPKFIDNNITDDEYGTTTIHSIKGDDNERNSNDLESLLPGDPEVAPGEEAGDGVPGQVVDPALLPQLGHDRVDPGEARVGVRPFGQGVVVVIPRDLKHFHFTKQTAIDLLEAVQVLRNHFLFHF